MAATGQIDLSTHNDATNERVGAAITVAQHAAVGHPLGIARSAKPLGVEPRRPGREGFRESA